MNRRNFIKAASCGALLTGALPSVSHAAAENRPGASLPVPVDSPAPNSLPVLRGDLALAAGSLGLHSTGPGIGGRGRRGAVCLHDSAPPYLTKTKGNVPKGFIDKVRRILYTGNQEKGSLKIGLTLQKKGIVYVSAGAALLFIYHLQLFGLAVREHFLLDSL